MDGPQRMGWIVRMRRNILNVYMKWEKEGIGVGSAQILNKSMQTGDVAQEWRDTLMENWNKLCIVAYRPVAV